MSFEEKEEIKKEILSRISDVEKKIKHFQEQAIDVTPDVAIGRLTRMDAIQQKNMDDANLKTAKELLLILKSTLDRIEDHDFGICLVCKKPIPIRRILIVPESKVCVNCISKNKF